MQKNFQRLYGNFQLPRELENSICAIGNFDGVHLGHQMVLKKTLDLAKKYNKPALVLTFEPHPRDFFSKKNALFRLTSASEKAKIFEKLGFQAVIEQDFNKDFANLSANDFVDFYLHNFLKVSAIFVGEDFHFGKNRLGNHQFLKEKTNRCGISLQVIKPFCNAENTIISSSKIRNLLKNGQVEKAADFLGYRYSFSGIVEHGLKLGRKIGYPTANISFSNDSPLAYGVYSVRLRRKNGQIHDGVASIGVRPTVTDKNIPLLETYLFDFDENLYDKKVSILFFNYLRLEKKFDNLDDLVQNIQNDVVQSKKLLKNTKPISFLDQKLNF